MGYYNLQAEAFLAGQVAITPRPGQVLMQDLIPFEGRYYLQWGPFPAVLHAIAMLAGGSISDRLVCLLAGWLTSLLFLDVMFQLRRRFFPATPLWVCWWFFFAFALATPTTVVTLRGAVYHESIGVAALGVMTALWAFLRYSENYATGWLVVSGTALAAALTSRVSQAVYAVGLFVGLVLLVRQAGRPLKQVAWFAVPVAAGVVIMLGYNYARFHSPFEYGLRYLPSSWASVRPYALNRVPENFCHYMLAPFRLSRDVPWIRHVGWRPVKRVEVAEEMSSVVLASPFLLLAFLPRRRQPAAAARLFQWTVAGAGLLAFLSLLCYFWAARRYMQDFTPAWMIAAFLGVAARAPEGLARPRWRIPAGAVLTVSALLHIHLCFFQAFEWSPTDPNVLKAFARWSPVVRRIAPGPKLDEQEAIVNNDLGVIYLNQKRYVEAVQHFQQAAARMPHSERIQKNLRLARNLAGL